MLNPLALCLCTDALRCALLEMQQQLRHSIQLPPEVSPAIAPSDAATTAMEASAQYEGRWRPMTETLGLTAAEFWKAQCLIAQLLSFLTMTITDSPAFQRHKIALAASDLGRHVLALCSAPLWCAEAAVRPASFASERWQQMKSFQVHLLAVLRNMCQHRLE